MLISNIRAFILHMSISCEQIFVVVSGYLSFWCWLSYELAIRGTCVSQTSCLQVDGWFNILRYDLSIRNSFIVFLVLCCGGILVLLSTFTVTVLIPLFLIYQKLFIAMLQNCDIINTSLSHCFFLYQGFIRRVDMAPGS